MFSLLNFYLLFNRLAELNLKLYFLFNSSLISFLYKVRISIIFLCSLFSKLFLFLRVKSFAYKPIFESAPWIFWLISIDHFIFWQAIVHLYENTFPYLLFFFHFLHILFNLSFLFHIHFYIWYGNSLRTFNC